MKILGVQSITKLENGAELAKFEGQGMCVRISIALNK